MPDREKVIKGLEETEIMLKQAVDRGGEIAVMGAFKCYNHVSDARAFLKEQEAVEPVTQSSVYDPDTWFFVCGSCKKGVIDRGDKFCRWCGQAVKWDG